MFNIQKSTDVICHINKLKKKTHMIISMMQKITFKKINIYSHKKLSINQRDLTQFYKEHLQKTHS